MFFSFVIVLLTITGTHSRYESPPLLLPECRALRTQKMYEIAHRDDVNRLLISECSALPVTM